MQLYLLVLWLSVDLCHSNLAARQCCPKGTWLIRSKFCSDNETLVNLNCSQGKYILDPSSNEDDVFVVDDKGRLYSETSGPAGEDEFCLSERNNKSVALLCFPETSGDKPGSIRSIIFPILMSISAVLLLLTLVVYICVPSLRDLQGKCQMALVLGLALSYIQLTILQTNVDDSETTCLFQAYSVYFCTVSAFFWINASTFNIWRTCALQKCKLSEQKWLVLYLLWGYGVPFIMVLIALTADNVPGDIIRPNFGVNKCWFEGPEETWTFFYGPVAVLLVLNTIMFFLTIVMLCNSYRDSSAPKIRSLKARCWLYFKLFLLMGILWIFEVISFAHTRSTSPYEEDFYWLFTDCLNCLQGLFIFLILIVGRKRVRAALAKHKVCGVPWPASWALGHDVECDTVSSREDVDLEQLREGGDIKRIAG